MITLRSIMLRDYPRPRATSAETSSADPLQTSEFLSERIVSALHHNMT
jgi:hypothetical protein